MKEIRLRSVLKYAGAFIAWIIGSGFATGQEILQFFGSFGYGSIAVLALNLIGFGGFGMILLGTGFDHRADPDFNHYEYYCGRTLGRFYRTVMPVILALLIAVLISATGATAKQYYGISPILGSAVMAALLIAAYLAGFEKMVRIVSGISPFVICFAVFTGVYSLLRDGGHYGEIAEYAEELAAFRAAPHWLLSAMLYLSLNFLCGSTYYNALGKTADSKKSVVLGTLLGTLALLITMAVMNFAILCNAKDILTFEVPTLWLAQRISGAFGSAFSVILLLGMFSSCATTVWSFCSECFPKDPKKNRLFAVISVLACTALGFVPFGRLMSVIYPLIGYSGLIFMAAVAARGVRRTVLRKKGSR